MATRLTHEIGDLIGGYMVRAQLGRGGHGTVYRCVEPSHGRVKLIKEMHAFGHPGEVDSFLRYFQQEAELVASLDHPNLPRGQALTVDGPFHIDPATGLAVEADRPGSVLVPQRHYLLLDALDGNTLEHLCEHLSTGAKRLSPTSVQAWIEQIGAALTHLHERGLVHRDVKPANIVIDADGERAMLIDLGLTTPQGQVPGYGTQPIRESGRFGTLGYAPPDPVELDHPSPLSDLHALAMTMRRALSGLDPTDPEQLEQLRRASLLELRADIEPYQAAVLDRAIRPEAGERPSSVEAFLEGLRRPPTVNINPAWSYWVELRPPRIEAGQLRPGQVRELSLVIHDKRPGTQPEGEAVSEDPNLKLLPPVLRGLDVILPLVLRVPPRQEPGHYRTALTVRTSHEEHEVSVTYEVVQRAAGSRRGGCLTLGLGLGGR